jgi:hypothetical protein
LGAKNLLLTLEQEAKQQEHEEGQGHEDQAQAPVPPIPLEVMQRLGQFLGIAAGRLSKEQHEAAPDGKKGKEPTDD